MKLPSCNSLAPRVVCAVACVFLVTNATNAQGPVAGQNINMVSGTTFPNGDPFLQRQNEPSIAVSTRNPLHLLGGANDYRAVNVEMAQGSPTGDAWLGVFDSIDGGATWISNLLPGYPTDQSAQGLASPLHGLTTAADPTVRSAPAGLFYYSGIAFNRGTNIGVVFVSRFMDLNNVEGANAIQYISTVAVDSGTAGQFLDKPYLAVGLPTGGTCTIQVPQGGTTVSQTVPAAPIYLVWSRFTGSTSTKIMFTESLDCGATWSNLTKLSESNSINQGTTLGVGPTGAQIYAAWRRFATSSQPDAIVVATSTDAGKTFGKGVDAIDLPPFSSTNPNGPSFFDQMPSTNCTQCLRTLAFPAIAFDSSGLAYLAWSQRGFATAGQARIAISTSTNGATWTAPSAIDNGPLNDRGLDILDTSGNTLTQGHEFMPAMTFTGGKLMVTYYDEREDHTIGQFTANNPFAPDPTTGLFYKEARGPRGELPGSPQLVFTPFLADGGLTLRRHTIDVVVAQANPAAQPAFTTARVSQYKFGLANNGSDIPGELQQLQVNPPNLPLFVQGTTAFMGDYIDVGGLSFLPPAVTGGAWQFNNSGLKSPVHYVTWTDNRDVEAPSDGNWTLFTPPGSSSCDPGHVGDRNQNIYVSRITQGLQILSPQNSKPLSTSFQRAFVVIVRNFTSFDKSFRLTIANQPAGGYASFLPGINNPPSPPTPPSPVTTTLDLAVPAHSGLARPVFATSSNPTAAITVNGDEITSLGGSLVSGGLSSFVVLNPDPTAPALSGGDIGAVELYDANMANAVFDTGSLSNGSLSNGSLSNTELSNGSLTNGSLSNGSLSNGSLANGSLTNGNLANLSASSGSLTNGNLANGSLSNGNLSNGSLTNTSVSDATYTVTNTSNTTGSYTVKLIGNGTTIAPNVQVIVSQTYFTPFGLGCARTLQQPQSIILANITSPVQLDASGSLSNGSLSNGSLSNGSLSNTTVAIPPGESVQITIRGIGVTLADLQQMTTQLAPVAVPHAADTNDPTNTPKFAAPLFIVTATLSNGTLNTPYTATLQAIGGTAPLSWTVSLGSLPAGLSLDPNTGIISGTPTAAGTSSFTVQVSDSSSPARVITKALTLTINKGTTTTTITSVAPGATTLIGQPITISWTVASSPPGPAAPTGTVTVSDGIGDTCTGPVTAGSCTLTPSATSPTTFNLTASYPGDANFNGSTSPPVSHSVVFYTFTGFLSPLSSAGTFASPSFSGTANLGSAIPIKWQVQMPDGTFVTSLSSTVLLESVFTPVCVGSPVGPMIVLFSPTSGATGGSTFRYDLTSNQFIFNWDTSAGVTTGPGCYTLLLQLNDKSPLKGTSVQLK